MKLNTLQKTLFSAILALTSAALLVAQPPAGGPPGGGKGGPGGPGGGKGGPPRVVFSVSSTAFPDGGEVPKVNAGVGDNKSPDFTFHWTANNADAPAPDTLQSYAVIFHDIENASAKGPVDTLHWSAFNIPGTAKGLPAGLGSGDLPDGTRNGPGINRGGTPGYFGPGAGPGPFHHYVWEFYALDTKLDLPANTTRDALWKALEGHVIGKAAYVGRFHNQ